MLTEAAARFKGLIGEGAFIRRGEGDRVKESTVSNFHQVFSTLMGD